MKILTCWYCGREVPSDEVQSDGRRAFHADCLLKFQKERGQRLDQYLTLKAEIMFERALRQMEKQDKLDINDYYDEAEVVHDMAIGDPDKFQSSDEMMAAMELVHNRVQAKVQFKIGRRRVDFLLPYLYVVLEIDGSLHKFKIRKDSAREIEIMNSLNQEGGHWEIIRIPTGLIEQNLTALVPAIKVLYRKRQQLRKANGGFLPVYWSQTNREAQRQVLDGIKDATTQDMYPYMDNTDEL